MKSLILTLVACLALMAAPAVPGALAADSELLVFAAASTTNAVTDVGEAFMKQHQTKVVNSFASSSNLAKQIAQGAPAQVYISANVKWMNFVEEKGAIVPESRFNLLRNRLVLIAPANSPLGDMQITKDTDLLKLMGDGRLAMGDPDHVPAGMYAKQALVSLNFWDKVKDKIAASANVRAALALVESGEAPLGMVYSTDAAISKKVKVLGMFPNESHKPIVYPVAMVKGAGDTAKAYLEFLKTPESMDIFKKYGFMPF